MDDKQLKEFTVSVFRTSLYSDNDVTTRALDQLTEDELFWMTIYSEMFSRLCDAVFEQKRLENMRTRKHE